MTNIKIEPDSVDDLSASISTAAGEIEGKLASLTSASNTLQGRWSGEAMQAYSGAYTSWAADMAAMAKVGSAAAKAATTAATAFRTADDSVGSLWSI